MCLCVKDSINQLNLALIGHLAFLVTPKDRLGGSWITRMVAIFTQHYVTIFMSFLILSYLFFSFFLFSSIIDRYDCIQRIQDVDLVLH